MMYAIRTGSHQSKFLFIVLFVLCVNCVSCSVIFSAKPDNDGQLDNTTNEWHSNGVNWQGSNGESLRQGRLFFPMKTRLFGARRRIQFALLPIMFKLGVIVTLLVGLTVMVLKGLTIGVILLFFALGNSLLKLKHHIPQQPVHFHLHPGDLHGGSPVYHHHGYSHGGSWDKASDNTEGVSGYENYDPGSHHRLIPIKYPYRFRTGKSRSTQTYLIPKLSSKLQEGHQTPEVKNMDPNAQAIKTTPFSQGHVINQESTVQLV